jgi:4-hydroxy-tetrahydrodipicolinate synthase
MKTRVFTGAATAIVTPFNENGVDYESFSKLIEWQIEEGINGLVVCGTTGEGSTLTDEEHKAVIKFAVEQVNKRVPVIAGTGSNDTNYAIDLTKYASEVGADAALVVTPYYNKATQNGLVEVFTKIADESTIPIILYNVPSRTGVNIEANTCKILAEHPNIVAIKEASGNISQIAHIAQLCGDKLDIYSGNDDEIVPIMSLGGIGVISVLSNAMPRETVKICDKFFQGDIEGSCQLQLKYIPFIKSLFCEVNPIPVKAAMAAMGYCENNLRLPLTKMESHNEEKMLNIMSELGIKLV